MKKIILILVILFAALENYAQFNLGPKAGYSASKLSTNIDTITESAKNNFQIGAFFRFGKRLYVQPEVYYATSGGKFEVSGTSITQDVQLKTIGVPVLVGLKLINAKVVNARILAGPVANFKLGTKVKATDLVIDPYQDSNFKTVAWGFDIGAGLDFFFLTFDLRYEIGLNNIYKNSGVSSDEKMRSNIFIISLGFKLL